MIIKILKCQMCGKQFEAEVLDRQDPRERHEPGSPVRCPNCDSTQIEPIRVLRRVKRAG